MIPLVDLAAQQARLRSEINAGIARVLEHGKYILGPEVEELEDKMAAYTGRRALHHMREWYRTRFRSR